MTQCPNKKNLLPREKSEKYLMVWFDCGHYEHESCWREHLVRFIKYLPRCTYAGCKNRFPLVIETKIIGAKVKKLKTLDKVSDQVKDRMSRDPVATVKNSLKKFHQYQYDYDWIDIEPDYKCFFSLSYWKKFLSHFKIRPCYESLLLSSVENNDIEMVKVISTNTNPSPYLHYAAIYGYTVVTDLLIKNKANPNFTNKAGLTPLHYASRYGHIDVVDILIQSGANPNAKDVFGKTPLHYAAEASVPNHKLISLLVKGGADKTIKAENGYSVKGLHFLEEL